MARAPPWQIHWTRFSKPIHGHGRQHVNCREPGAGGASREAAEVGLVIATQSRQSVSRSRKPAQYGIGKPPYESDRFAFWRSAAGAHVAHGDMAAAGAV